MHRGSKEIWTVDVQKYFPNTTPRKVFEFFTKSMECAQDVALLLTQITTRYDHLPTGSPASPIVAFWANKTMWDEVYEICKRHDLKMSLYMDDLTVSGNKVTGQVRQKIRRLILKQNFSLHKERHIVNKPTKVTGPIVKKNMIDAPNSHYKKMRLLKKQIKKSKCLLEKERLKQSLRGLREYTMQIRNAK